MPEVLIALATGLAPPASALARSFIRLSTFIGVSSLCSSGAWAAWRISSSNTARGAGAALEMISHCVASGSGMYSEACRPSRRKCGRPLPYLQLGHLLRRQRFIDGDEFVVLVLAHAKSPFVRWGDFHFRHIRPKFV